MDNAGFYILMALVGAAGGGFVYLGWRAWRFYQLITETKTSKLQFVRQGLAEIQGKVVAAADSVLESPYTLQKCVYYEFVVTEKRGKHTHTVVRDVQSVPCLVDDGTGQAELPLGQATLVLNQDVRGRTGFFGSESPELERALSERYQRSTQGVFFSKSMSYRETALAVGDEVYVLGWVDKHEHTPRFTCNPVLLVSDKGERHLTQRYLFQAVACGVAVLVALVAEALIVAGLLGVFR